MGKQDRFICEELKRIRLEIARANDIEYEPTPCEYEGDCPGTCPACENEVRYLEKELAKKNANFALNYEIEEHSDENPTIHIIKGHILPDVDPGVDLDILRN